MCRMLALFFRYWLRAIANFLRNEGDSAEEIRAGLATQFGVKDCPLGTVQ
jgi:hypothetical protein